MSEQLDPTARQVRVVRGVLAASVAVLVALVAHVAGGGAVPSIPLVCATVVFAWLPGIALIGRRPSLWRQSVTILIAQAMLHGLFLVESGAPAAIGRSTRAMPGMAMGTSSMPTTAGMAAVAASGWQLPGVLMWVMHAAAAVATIAAWRHGEAILRALLRCVLHCVSAAAALRILTPSGRAHVPTRRSIPVVCGVRAAAGVLRRGPPRVV